jgi:dihydrofolate reductase
MRKVVAGLYISVDGVVESPDKWQFDNFDADVMSSMGSQLEAEDTVLLGRVTYQEWAAYWPTSTDEPFASFINNIPKYVISTTLERADWSNSTLVKGSFREEITRLKGQPGKNIGVAGSPTLVHSLLFNNLLDELVRFTLLLWWLRVQRWKRSEKTKAGGFTDQLNGRGDPHLSTDRVG